MRAFVRKHIVPAAFALLPAPMTSPEAVRLVMAIGWQESRFQHRRQIGGPASGFWQFETAGVSGVLSHTESRDLVRSALKALEYPHEPTPYGCHLAIEHNDILACIFARLLVWTLPEPLPTTAEAGWLQYLRAWRPGRPHHETWAQAWAVGGEA